MKKALVFQMPTWQLQIQDVLTQVEKSCRVFGINIVGIGPSVEMRSQIFRREDQPIIDRDQQSMLGFFLELYVHHQ